LAVELLGSGVDEVSTTGAVSSIHEGELMVAPEAVAGLLTRSFIEQVAFAYRRFLGRLWFGLLRVRVEPEWEAIGWAARWPTLLRFHAPLYRIGDGWAEVSWRIDRGLLVARGGWGQGSLRIRLERREPGGKGEAPARVLARAEVQDYHPLIRGRGGFARAANWVYGHTQARIHRHVMRGFLRSLATLELPVDEEPSSSTGREGG
jgi:hypothetical protein